MSARTRGLIYLGLIHLGLSALGSHWLVSCTLTGDSFEPSGVIAPLSPAMGGAADAGSAAPGVPSPQPDIATPPACGGGELTGCSIELRPGACRSGADCESRSCRDGACQPPSCEDGVQNQDEGGLDCGGSLCPRCSSGARCAGDSDCDTGFCAAGACGPGMARCCQVPSCGDGVANGTEPVVDCGDDRCGPCPDGHPCSADAQCASQRCQQGACRPEPCEDGVRNGTETDTDCGGDAAGCARCAAGGACAADGDCASNDCSGGRCSSCGDGLRNGAESGVDCGGECGPCAPGASCRADADCQSGACEDGRCCGGTRADCTRCAQRLAQVLSCNSNGPQGAAQCAAFLDCLADNSALCPVRYAPGCSDSPGGVCNHDTFGGNAGPGVALADAILGTAGCTFGDE